MAKIHYLKREKQGKLIQLLIVTEFSDDFGGFINSVKYDIDPAYKSVFSYLKYPIPHEELTEIAFDEFCELCAIYGCLAVNEPPVPGYPRAASATV